MTPEIKKIAERLLEDFDIAFTQIHDERLNRRRKTYRQQDMEALLSTAAKMADFMESLIKGEEP